MEQQLTKYTVRLDDYENHSNLTLHLRNALKGWREYSEIVIVCIGTDRSSGDCLGPLVGDMINTKLKMMTLYGTLENPVHALTLEDTLALIETQHENPLVIAIDAGLGNTADIGDIILKNAPIRPGAAVGKDLPPVGTYSITAIVNVGGYMPGAVLQNTRLNTVMKMARIISNSILEVDKRIYNSEKQRQKRSFKKQLAEVACGFINTF